MLTRLMDEIAAHPPKEITALIKLVQIAAGV
jgi:hypothetical protein